jgi:aldehyde oxidoreductase
MRRPDGRYRTYDEMVKEGIPTKYLGVFDTTGMGVDLDPNTGVGSPTPTYSYGFFLAEVAVDTTTGKVQVLSMALEQDNRARRQPAGRGRSVLRRTGTGRRNGLSEDYYDVKKHTNLIACGFPYIMDAPDDMEIGYQETAARNRSARLHRLLRAASVRSHTAILKRHAQRLRRKNARSARHPGQRCLPS